MTAASPKASHFLTMSKKRKAMVVRSGCYVQDCILLEMKLALHVRSNVGFMYCAEHLSSVNSASRVFAVHDMSKMLID